MNNYLLIMEMNIGKEGNNQCWMIENDNIYTYVAKGYNTTSYTIIIIM